MAYKNQRKQHAHVRELHRKQGLGKQKQAKIVKLNSTYEPTFGSIDPKPKFFNRLSTHIYKLFKF
jgi:hypothetical protein